MSNYLERIGQDKIEDREEIEQLTARVRELEEENARLVKLDTKRKKQLDAFDDVIDDLNVVVSCINPVEDLKRAIAALKEQAAASQAYAEQLREKIEALWDIIDDIDTYGDMAKADDKLFRSLVEKRQKDRWETGITTDGYVLNMSIPRDTSALDAYVAEKVKEATEKLHYRMKHCYSIDGMKAILDLDGMTRQRDLAVDALEYVKGCFDAAEFEGLSDRISETNVECGSLADLVMRRLSPALSTVEHALSTIKESEEN